MSKVTDFLILDEFCLYEPTNKEDDFDMRNYKMLESTVRYIRKEHEDDRYREVETVFTKDNLRGL